MERSEESHDAEAEMAATAVEGGGAGGKQENIHGERNGEGAAIRTH